MLNPSQIVSAIQDPSTSWTLNHIVVDSVDNWFRVDGNDLELTTSSSDKKMKYQVYALLKGEGGYSPATVNGDNTVTTDNGRFQLVIGGAGSAYVTFADPV